MLRALIYMQIDRNLPLACRAWLSRISEACLPKAFWPTEEKRLWPAVFNWSFITEHFSMCWMDLTVTIWHRFVGWFTTCRALLNYYIQQTHSLNPVIRGYKGGLVHPAKWQFLNRCYCCNSLAWIISKIECCPLLLNRKTLNCTPQYHIIHSVWYIQGF